MTVEHYRLLFEHNAWANNRVVEQIANVGYDVALQPAGLDMGDGSILETLVHALSAERRWYARCQGDEAPEALSAENTSIEAIRDGFETQASEWQAFLGRLKDPGLDAISSNPSKATGEIYSHPLWVRLSHVLSHSTQHRGELALITSRAGHSPGNLDYLEYYDSLR